MNQIQIYLGLPKKFWTLGVKCVINTFCFSLLHLKFGGRFCFNKTDVKFKPFLEKYWHHINTHILIIQKTQSIFLPWPRSEGSAKTIRHLFAMLLLLGNLAVT